MKNESQMNSIISRLMSTNNSEDIKQVYQDWSESYDQDVAGFGYVAPQIGTALFHEACGNTEGLIFDAGCGTGLCGQALATKGYRRLHGVDYSAEMLAKARDTGCYLELWEANFCDPLDIADDTYDGVICFGVYKSIFKEYLFSELVRITKSDGVLCFSCRFSYFDTDLRLQAEDLVEKGLITIESINKQPYMTGQQADAAYIVLKKC
ncbi:MAG: class I SAM-dependent methyltransferase [Chloroflexota bacterium]